MWRLIAILAGLLFVNLLVAGISLLLFVPWETLGCGKFDLAVVVEPSGGRICAVTSEAFQRREEAESALEQLTPPSSDWCSATEAPFTGQPLKTRVPFSQRTSALGREIDYIQFHYLVVIAELQDGRRVGKLVDIPDGRMSREVHVGLP
jgi:hypothetical protein